MSKLTPQLCCGEAISTNVINKQEISQRFSSSAATYDGGAALQRQVGHHLLARLDQTQCLLDLGTGPGYFTQALHEKSQQLIGVDIAPNMLDFAQQRNQSLNVHWLAGDAEKLPLATASVNGIFSSLMLQWVHHLPIALAEAYRVLEHGGQLVFSTLLDGTLYELAQAWREVDDNQHINSFLSHEQLRQYIQQSDFEIDSIEIQPQVLYYQDVLGLMRDLKAIGANQTANRQPGLMGRSTLNKLAQGYAPFSTPNGLSASYQVAFCSLRKVTGKSK